MSSFRPTHKLTVTSKTSVFTRQPPVSVGIPHIDPRLNFRFVLVTAPFTETSPPKYVTTDFIVSLSQSGSVFYFKDSRGTFFKLEPL